MKIFLHKEPFYAKNGGDGCDFLFFLYKIGKNSLKMRRMLFTFSMKSVMIYSDGLCPSDVGV